MKVFYFAWLRERLNRAGDEVNPPANVVTVAELVDWLCARDDALALAMSNRAIFRYSLDARIVPPTTEIGPARALAILPPMTGG